MADTEITNMLITALVDHLTTALIDNVSQSDPSRASIVKAGRFLDDPTVDNIFVAIHGGDPEKPEYLDGIVTIEDFKRVAFNVPAREVGGTGKVAWWRRGICQFGCYFTDGNYEETEAMTYARRFYGRIQANIENMTVRHLSDSFNEDAVHMLLAGATMFPSGGDGSWIWRGKVLWQCLTYKG